MEIFMFIVLLLSFGIGFFFLARKIQEGKDKEKMLSDRMEQMEFRLDKTIKDEIFRNRQETAISSRDTRTDIMKAFKDISR